jgi:hypothetical protein
LRSGRWVAAWTRAVVVPASRRADAVGAGSAIAVAAIAVVCLAVLGAAGAIAILAVGASALVGVAP